MVFVLHRQRANLSAYVFLEPLPKWQGHNAWFCETSGVRSCMERLSGRFLYRRVLITQSLKIKAVLCEAHGMDLLEDLYPPFVPDGIYTPEMAELQG